MLMCAESRRYFSTIDLFLKPKIEVELPEYEGLPNKIAVRDLIFSFFARKEIDISFDTG
jgi:hypothetical protein